MNEHTPVIGPAGFLLSASDPDPVNVLNQGGGSPFLLVGDHAGREVPARLVRLGLEPEAFDLHIAWDIGVAGMGALLADMLDACFIHQSYSRLVIDCNRRLADPSVIPAESDRISIPGNVGAASEDFAAREAEIYRPYHGAIADELDRRLKSDKSTMLVSLHSFTPVYQGVTRPWRFGVLHRNDSRLSAFMLASLQAEWGDAAGDNQPYALDEKDNTIPLHAHARGIDYLELEVRQDLIAEDTGQAAAASLIGRMLTEARAALGSGSSRVQTLDTLLRNDT